MGNGDREILRELAKHYAEITNSPDMDARRERWYAHNDLIEGRPLILCFPEGSWSEIIHDDEIRCEGAAERGFEYALRTKIYWYEVLKDDAAQEPCVYVNPSVDLGDYGMEAAYYYSESRGSCRWEHPMENLDGDVDKLRLPEFTYDADETERRLEEAHGIFDGTLSVKLRPGLDLWTLGMTEEVIKLVGLDKYFLYMYDNPEGLHRLMAFLRDAKLKMLDWYERMPGVAQPNDRDGYTGSGGQAYTRDFDETAVNPLMRMWGFAESQETVGVSPKMFGEFVFPYQLPLLERFGLNCYGCCEPVHDRMKYLKQIPRLRRVSISPWCDQRIMAEALGRSAVFSRKPNPSLVCASFNEEAARADIAGTLEAAKGCNVELILKDTHTVQHEPRRLSRWVEVAREEIAKRY